MTKMIIITNMNIILLNIQIIVNLELSEYKAYSRPSIFDPLSQRLIDHEVKHGGKKTNRSIVNIFVIGGV